MKASADSAVKNTRKAAKYLGNDLAIFNEQMGERTLFFVRSPKGSKRVGTAESENVVAISTALLAEVARLRGEKTALQLTPETLNYERKRLIEEVGKLRRQLYGIRRQERGWGRPLPLIEARMNGRRG